MPRFVRSPLFRFVSFLLLLACCGAAAQAQVTYYEIVARHKVMDVAGGSYDNGAQGHQWDYVGISNQQWMLRGVRVNHPPWTPNITEPSTEGQYVNAFDVHGDWRLLRPRRRRARVQRLGDSGRGDERNGVGRVLRHGHPEGTHPPRRRRLRQLLRRDA